MWLIAGLGNPGTRYEKTRHNVGFMTADHLARSWGTGFSEKSRHRAWVARAETGTGPVLLAKPATYMNDSGWAIRSLADYFGIPPEKTLVILDDMSLGVGVLRIRARGGDGGHRGLGSAIGHLGTTAFPRLRIGIGTPPGPDWVRHVLAEFPAGERELVEAAVEKAGRAVPVLLGEGVERAMSEYNG